MAADTDQGSALGHPHLGGPGRPGLGAGAQAHHGASCARCGHLPHQRSHPARQPGHDPLPAHPGQALAARKGRSLHQFRHGGLPAPPQPGVPGHHFRPHHRPSSPHGRPAAAGALLRHPPRFRCHQHHDDPLPAGSAHQARAAALHGAALRHPHGYRHFRAFRRRGRPARLPVAHQACRRHPAAPHHPQRIPARLAAPFLPRVPLPARLPGRGHGLAQRGGQRRPAGGRGRLLHPCARPQVDRRLRRGGKDRGGHLPR